MDTLFCRHQRKNNMNSFFCERRVLFEVGQKLGDIDLVAAADALRVTAEGSEYEIADVRGDSAKKLKTLSHTPPLNVFTAIDEWYSSVRATGDPAKIAEANTLRQSLIAQAKAGNTPDIPGIEGSAVDPAHMTNEELIASMPPDIDQSGTPTKYGKSNATLGKNPERAAYNSATEAFRKLVGEKRSSMKQKSIPDRIAAAKHILYTEFGFSPASQQVNVLEKITGENPSYNASFSNSKPIMMLYENWFFDTPPLGKYAAFYAPEYVNGQIQSTPETLKGDLLHCEAGGTIKLTGGLYNGPFLANNTVHIIGAGAASIIGDAEGKRAQGAAMYLKGKGSSIKGVAFSCPKTNIGLVTMGHETTVENVQFSQVKTGIQAREKTIIKDVHVANYSKDGLSLCGNDSVLDNFTLGKFTGKDGSHNDGIQIFKGSERMKEIKDKEGNVIRTEKQYFEGKESGKYTLSGLVIKNSSINGEGHKQLQGLANWKSRMKDSTLQFDKIDVGSTHPITLEGPENVTIDCNNWGSNPRVNITPPVKRDSAGKLSYVSGIKPSVNINSTQTVVVHVPKGMDTSGIKGNVKIVDDLNLLGVDPNAIYTGEGKPNNAPENISVEAGSTDTAKVVTASSSATVAASHTASTSAGGSGGSYISPRADSGRRIVS